jgi:hypothetical protein
MRQPKSAIKPESATWGSNANQQLIGRQSARSTHAAVRKTIPICPRLAAYYFTFSGQVWGRPYPLTDRVREMLRFLRRIAIDPMTGGTDWAYAQCRTIRIPIPGVAKMCLIFTRSRQAPDSMGPSTRIGN